MDPQLTQVLIIQGGGLLVTAVSGFFAYRRYKVTRGKEIAKLQITVQQQLENTIWDRAHLQLKDMEDKLEACEEHRAKDAVVMQRMRLTTASLEVIVMRMRQELERRGISIPPLHIVADLAGDDPMFTEMLMKIDQQFHKNSTRPVSSAVEQVLKEKADGPG